MQPSLAAALIAVLGLVAGPADLRGTPGADAGPAVGTPSVDPGGIATIVMRVTHPDPATGDTLLYELTLEPGFRAYIPTAGALTASPGENVILLPVTVGVPADAASGRTFVGRLRTGARGVDAGSEDSVWVDVNGVYAVGATLEAGAPTVAPGGPLELRYRVRNRGNAVDTVVLGLRIAPEWETRGLPRTVAIAPGDSVLGTVLVTAPGAAPRGRDQSMTLVATGAGRTIRSTVTVLLAAEDPAFLEGWAHLPSTVFMGGSLGGTAGSSLALESAGEVATGTRVAVSIRHRQGPLLPSAFQDYMFGPRFRVAVRRAGMRASIGEVQTLGGALSAPVISGRGFQGRIEASGWSADVHAARPGGLGSDIEGHQLRAQTRYDTGRGHVGLTVADIRENWPWLPGYRSTGVGLGYRLPDSGRHDLWLQAGVLAVRADSGGSATGPAMDARYRFSGDAARLEIRGRLVPGTAISNAAMGNELVANGVYEVAPRLSLKAWGQLQRARILDSEYEPENTALFVGARAAMGPAQLELGGLHRRSGNGLQPATGRRTAVVGLDLPLGAVALQADAQIGRFERGAQSGPVREVWGGAVWYGTDAGTWARLGARYTDSEYVGAPLYLDLAGATRLHRLRLEGGVSTRFQSSIPMSERIGLWSSVQVEALPRTFVTAGTDYQPGSGDGRWRISLGVSRSLGLPFPLRRAPELHGLVFEDRNGNRIHDADEPVLHGVRLEAGRLETRTDARGTFAFRTTYGRALRVDPSSLPARMALLPDVHLPAKGEVRIPVVEAGAIEVDLFMDRNGDGTRDPAEEAAAEILVSLVDARGISRDLESDGDGRVRFGAVAPGTYTLRVLRRVTGSTAAATVERSVRVEPGQATAVTIPVPARARGIRMGPRARIGGDPEL